jgi:MFS family permease
VLTPTRAWLLVLVATATMAVSYVDRQALAALAPTITKDLDLTETQFGWVGSAFSLAYLVGTPISGALVDRVGARSALPVAVLLWSAVAASHALVPSLGVLLALRIALGAAESPGFPSAAQTISRALPPDRREAGFGVLFTGSSVGAAVAGALLPWLEGRYGWRPALLVSAGVGLAWLPAWWAVSRGAEVRRTLAAPTAHHPPVDWWALARDPAVIRAVLAVLASAPINGLALQWGAKVLVAQHHLTQQQVGAYLWLPPLGLDAGAVLFGWAASHETRRTGSDAPHTWLLGAAGALLATIGLLGLAPDPWATTLVLTTSLVGGGAIYALCTADLLSRVAPERIAAAGSLPAAAQSLALIVAFPLIGRVLDLDGHDYAPIGLGLAAWALPGVIAWLAWDPRRRG